MGVVNLRAICPNCGGKIHTQPKGLGHVTFFARSWVLVQTGRECQHCGVALSGRVKAGNQAELASQGEERQERKAERLRQQRKGPEPICTGSGNTDVFLAVVGAKKVPPIKVIRKFMGLGLKDAKDLVDAAPTVIAPQLNAADAQRFKARLEEAGATVELRSSGGSPANGNLRAVP